MTDTAFAAAARRAAGFACTVLAWRPAEFWASTPAELATALRGLAGDAPPALDADGLATLKEQFPDG